MNRIEALGVVIRNTRLALNISQEKLAEIARIHRNALGRIERSEVVVTVGTLCQIADALGVAASELIQSAEKLTEREA
jgi:transcriptional regulator with XRE-family HTH domain